MVKLKAELLGVEPVSQICFEIAGREQTKNYIVLSGVPAGHYQHLPKRYFKTSYRNLMSYELQYLRCESEYDFASLITHWRN